MSDRKKQEATAGAVASSSWLDRLREAGEAATEAPWFLDGGRVAAPCPEWYGPSGYTIFPMGDSDNSAFAVLARNKWPLLVAVVEAAEAYKTKGFTVIHFPEKDTTDSLADYTGRCVPDCVGCALDAALASLRASFTTHDCPCSRVQGSSVPVPVVREQTDE